MTLLGWLAVACWAPTAVYGFRVVLYEMARIDKLDAALFLFVLFASVCFGTVGGPFIVAYRLFEHVTRGANLTPVAMRVAAEPPHVKAKRLEREAKARERRIRDLERELELR